MPCEPDASETLAVAFEFGSLRFRVATSTSNSCAMTIREGRHGLLPLSRDAPAEEWHLHLTRYVIGELMPPGDVRSIAIGLMPLAMNEWLSESYVTRLTALIQERYPQARIRVWPGVAGVAELLRVRVPEAALPGTLLMDCGARRTTYALLGPDGRTASTGVAKGGGDHVTNDLSLMFHISMAAADKIKNALCTDKILSTAPSMPCCPATVAAARVREALEDLHREIFRDPKAERIRAVYCTGGGSLLAGFYEMAGQVFGVPAHPLVPQGPHASIRGLLHLAGAG